MEDGAMTAQLFNLDAERKARRIGRESAGAVYLLPLHVGAFFVEAWLDALSRAELPRWPGMED
jgi:hypothetical protein